jgi:Zn-dependent alcohol dehydrogenase
MIYHFMGCSTFAEYAVLASISLAKINPESNPNTGCVLGCGIPTGWGAVMNNKNFHAKSSVAVWGLGAVGLAVIQAAKFRGADRIYAVDINEKKFPIAKQFGATHCVNPKESNTRQWLLDHEKWGINFTYDCTGVVAVMREALEMAHRGFGESMVIGVASAGQEIATRPFQLVTGRQWKGTAFGGWKSVEDVPKLSDKILLGEYPIDDYVTHNFEGLDKIQDLIDALKSGDCLRGVLKISPYDYKGAPDIKVEKS